MKPPEDVHLRIRDVRKTFALGPGRSLRALDGVNLDVARGEFLCVLGPSGCGKTTLIKLIAGLIAPDSGEISVGGRSPREAREGREFGLVFQEPALLAWRDVAANVRLPLEINARNRPDDAPSVQSLLRLVGLEDYADYHPHRLSGGMRQRVAIARALAAGAGVLLMDEPFGSLDEITRAAMRRDLARIWQARKKTVVFVTHSVAEAAALADRVAVMSARPGRIADVIPIDLPRPRDESMEWRPDFLRYSKSLYDALRRGGGSP